MRDKRMKYPLFKLLQRRGGVTFFISCLLFLFCRVNSNALAQREVVDTVSSTTRNEPVIEKRAYDKSGRKTGEWTRYVITKSGQDSLILVTKWKRDRISFQRQFNRKNGYSDSYFDQFERIQKREIYINERIHEVATYRYLFRDSEIVIRYHPNGKKKKREKWKEFNMPDGELVRTKRFLKHGKWIEFDETGKKSEQTRFKKGKKD